MSLSEEGNEKNENGGRLEDIPMVSDERIDCEVADFLREVVEAVAYTVDRQKALLRRHKRSHIEHISTTEISSDSSSATRSTRRKGANPKSQKYVNRRRHRRTSLESAAVERKKKLKGSKQIATGKVKELEAAAEKKRRKKEEAMREKERLKREREEARERKRKEEQQKREQKKKEDEERKERRRMEEEARKQKKQKEEEERARRKKEEEEKRERKRKDEEAAELRKKRQSDRFLSFFSKIEKPAKTTEVPSTPSVLNILPFFCKQGVSLAPQFRREPLSDEVHDHLLEISPPEKSYLLTVKPRTICKVKLNRAKLFQFHDNYRPPYYGTWRKRSTTITGRRPFAKDTKILDYEVDSDEEWEVPEGDDCDETSESDDEGCGHSAEDEDDGFIVGHGYLSEGEGEDEPDRAVPHEESSNRATRLKAIADEWENNRKQKSAKYKKPMIPMLWGPHFDLLAENVPTEAKLGSAVFFDYPSSNEGDEGNTGEESRVPFDDYEMLMGD